MTTRNLDRTAAAIALLLLAGCRAVGAGEDSVSIDLKAEMSARSFLTEQTVQVRLTLENRAAIVASVPNPLLNDLTPEYIVTDPHGKQTTVTHAVTHAKLGARQDPEAPPSTEMMDLAPKAKWSEMIPLDPMLPLTEPGPYRLQVAFTAGKDRVLSPAMEFRILPSNVTAFAVAAQGPDARGARLSTAWAHGTGSEIALADAVRLGGLWGKDSGGKLYSSVVYRGEGPPVRQIAVPAMHGDRGMDFANWIVWEQGGKIQAQRTEAGEAKGAAELVYASAKAVQLIQAPVMDRQHNLSVFLVESDGTRAQLLRIDVARIGTSPPKTQYRLPLPFAPVAVQAAHFRENGQERTLIFLLFSENGGITISAATGGPSPQLVPVTRLDNALPMPGNPLAAYSRDDGRTYVAAAIDPGKGAAISVAMAEVKSSGLLERGPAVHTVSLGDNAALAWGFLAAGPDGPHLLWRDEHGRLTYVSVQTEAVMVIPAFRLAPPPALLIGDRTVFAAGVRESGAFGIERLSRANVRPAAAK